MADVILGVPGETADDERRVALIPPVAAGLVEDGHEVLVAAEAGEASSWRDDQYEDAGCAIVASREEVFEQADVVFQVRGLAATDDGADPYRDGQIAIGQFGPYDVEDGTLEDLAERDVSAFALELIPRIGRAQSMDVLSSQASVAGYAATLMAAEALPKMFPMEMTAAGTVRPAEVFVIGAGVAGLKAIATAERLGASTRAYDIRLEVKREVESLGATFVELDLETEGSGDGEGYAREMDEEFYAEQRTQLERVVPESDVVITTAAIPGAPAPELVTTEMIEGMAPGSVVVDLSAPTGGNCEPTEPGATVTHEGVTIFGPTNLPSEVSGTASQLYANNLRSFFETLVDDEGDLAIDLDDEIVDSTLLVHDGDVRSPHVDDATDEPTDEAEADESEGDAPTATNNEADDAPEPGVEVENDDD